MMEFGSRDRFSIEIDLDKNSGGVWMFGRICYWISGEIVGNYEVGTSLRDVLFQMKYILGDQGRRYCPALVSIPVWEAFSLISSALEEEGNDIYKVASSNVTPACFDVRIHVDVFDSWRVFLVEESEVARLLYLNINNSLLRSAVISKGEFDRVFALAYTYLEEIYESLAGGQPDR